MEEGAIEFDFDVDKVEEFTKTFKEYNALNERLREYSESEPEYKSIEKQIIENKSKACESFVESIKLQEDKVPETSDKLKSFLEETEKYNPDQAKQIDKDR